MSVSGRGKKIKSNTNDRVMRINRALNKAIRNWNNNDSVENCTKVQHWQKILINYYESVE